MVLCGFRVKLVCLMFDGLRELILDKAHSSRCSIHPKVIKMFHDLNSTIGGVRSRKILLRMFCSV